MSLAASDFGPINEEVCKMTGLYLSTSLETIASQVIMVIMLVTIFHAILRRLYMPRLFSNMIVAIFIANIGFVRDIFNDRRSLFFDRAGHYFFSICLFALGLEMDPFTVFDPPGNAGYIAYAGMLSTLVITACCQKLLVNHKIGLLSENSVRANLGFGMALATTGSKLLTRLTTELKLSKTAVGQTAIHSGIFSNMIATFFMCIGNLIFHDDSKLSESEQQKHPLYVAIIVAEIIILMLGSKWVLNKINDQNPEGKPMKGIYLAGLLVAVISLCFLDKLFHMDINLAGFLIGLAMPREGRVSRLLINNLNFYLNSAILPFYLVNIFLSSRKSELNINPNANLLIDMPFSWPKLLISFAIGTVGKILGTVVSGRFFGMRWLDSIALGQLLSVKGYYHIFCAYEAWNNSIINDTSFLALLYMIMITSAITPLVELGIAAWVRRKVRSKFMGLQFHLFESELRIMVGLHGPQHLPIMLALVESMQWNKEPGKLTLYATDMIELTERAAATLVKGEGADAIEVMDEEIVDMRNQIGDALDTFQQQSNNGINVQRFLAISSLDDMDKDICMCAEDAKVALIIIPFHKSLRMDGTMDAGHAGFHQVNQKVLQRAPCSVGIMIDRGFGGTSQGSLSLVGKNVLAVFIGGGDDREALTLAAQMSQHPAIRLTVVRFFPDLEAHGQDNPRLSVFENIRQPFISREDVQTQMDSEFFAGFHQRHIVNKEVGYIEKYVANGAEMVMELREMEPQYELFVVGKGRDRKSIVTEGLDDWAECPELGPLGDVFTSSDFSSTASALIIQQYDAKKRYNVIDDEFMPFG